MTEKEKFTISALEHLVHVCASEEGKSFLPVQMRTVWGEIREALESVTERVKSECKTPRVRKPIECKDCANRVRTGMGGLWCVRNARYTSATRTCSGARRATKK
jgi:hypothetical protein